MITCSNDTLTINPSLTSEEIKHRLGQCAERYVSEWLPRILATDLPAVLEALLIKSYSWLSAERKQSARKEVGSFTDAEIGDRFRQLVSKRMGNCHSSEVDISFEKTLRVPDDGMTYPLPPGLGSFPIENVTHHAQRIPPSWSEVGGIMIPMHQSEAMWLSFETDWPTALKIGTGTVNAINGESWTAGLMWRPQGYVVLPEQPWLDGYCIAPGMVRQFVATGMGKGYSAEEQILGTLRGGLQLEAYPLMVESFFEKKLRSTLPRTAEELLVDYLPDPRDGVLQSQSFDRLTESMGLGAGGRIKQEIYEDQWEPEDWDLGRPSRTWVHLVDSATWKVVTGKTAPGKPLTAKQYTEHGFPWFDYYRDDVEPLDGSTVLANLKSVFDPVVEAEKIGVSGGTIASGLLVEAIGPDAPTDKVKEWDGSATGF